MSFLPYGRQTIEDDDIAAVAEVLRSGSLTGGPLVERFERAFAAKVGAPHAAACANGTAALHLASLALRLGPGDCVIVPSVTFLATANGPHYVGADVVFADVDPQTGLMTPDTFGEAMERTKGPAKAVFPVHLNGGCVDMAAVAAIARREGLAVVEDACHALGATVAGSGPVGNCRHSDMTVFSMHPVKMIAMGEGGVVTTGDATFDSRLRDMRNHGMVREPARFLNTCEAFDADGQANPWYYEMQQPGFNYRASDVHCALGLSQLSKLDRFLRRRRALADLYAAALAPLSPIVRPVPRVVGCNGGWHLYAVLIDFDAAGTSRRRAMKELRARGIGTQVHYLPVHRQPTTGAGAIPTLRSPVPTPTTPAVSRCRFSRRCRMATSNAWWRVSLMC